MAYTVEETTTCKAIVDGQEKMAVSRDHRTREFTLTILIEDGGEMYSRMDYEDIKMLKELLQYALETYDNR
jgi:hypothetical protein